MGKHHGDDDESTYRWAHRVGRNGTDLTTVGKDLRDVATYADTSMPIEVSLSTRIDTTATAMERIGQRGEQLLGQLRAALAEDFNRVENPRKNQRVEAAADYTAMQRDM